MAETDKETPPPGQVMGLVMQLQSGAKVWGCIQKDDEGVDHVCWRFTHGETKNVTDLVLSESAMEAMVMIYQDLLKYGTTDMPRFAFRKLEDDKS